MHAKVLKGNSLACLRSSTEAAAALEVGKEFGEGWLHITLRERRH